MQCIGLLDKVASSIVMSVSIDKHIFLLVIDTYRW
jgi:hypothetical protein